MTIYSDLWYKVIATPRYDKKIADSLRRAHNRLLQRKIKSANTGEFGVEVSRLNGDKATAKMTTYSEARYE